MTPVVWYLLVCFSGATSLEGHRIVVDYFFANPLACANIHRNYTQSHNIAPDRCICQPVSPVVPMDPLGHEAQE